MRRLFRWAFNLSAAVSALLFLMTCALWVRGYRVEDNFLWCLVSTRPEYRCVRVWKAQCSGGGMTFDFQRVPRPLNPPPWSFEFKPGFRHYTRPDVDPPDIETEEVPPGATFLHLGRSGLLFSRDKPDDVPSGPYHDDLYLVYPCWSVGALTAALPSLWLWSRLLGRHRKKRTARGHCPACGYDLRATPAAGGPLLGRCPECGAVPPSKVPA